MINGITIEMCIGNIDDALTVSKYPIDRIELNSALELGGLSPNITTIKILKEKIDIPLCCMCRPRGGDFYYSELEYIEMIENAKQMLEAKADGIVFGFLDANNNIDTKRSKEMIDLIHSYNKEAIFHKAFDEVNDLDEAIKQLIQLKVDRILTSGKAIYPDILEGCNRLNDLNQKYGDQIELLPGGGVRSDNVVDVLKISGLKQIHMTSKKSTSYLCLDEIQLQEILSKIESI